MQKQRHASDSGQSGFGKSALHKVNAANDLLLVNPQSADYLSFVPRRKGVQKALNACDMQ
jgi:hypothetical protein